MSEFMKWLRSAPVVWKPLGEVVNVVTAPSKAKRIEYAKEGVYPVIDQGIEFISGYVDATYQPIPKGEYVLFGDHSEHVKYVDFAFVQGADGLKILKTIQCNAKYVYYSLANFYIKKAGYKRHWSDAKETLIPIPPMEVQEEIVRILDKFTELIAALNKELELRRKQYDYYLHHLLTSNASYIPLGEVGEVRMCKRILKNQTLEEGDVPFYKIGTFGGKANAYITRSLYEEYKQHYNYPKKGEVLISASGTIGRTVIFDGEDAYFQDSNIVWIGNDESRVLNKYLYYCYQIISWNVTKGGTISRLYNDHLKKTLIPLPFANDVEKSLSEQERIVGILDKFERLTNSLTEGLPREIELRQKQYEYYRNLLLSFE